MMEEQCFATLANQSLLNNGGLLVRLQNAHLSKYYEKLGNPKPLKFGMNEACPHSIKK
jgi:hypothetical protein